MSWAISGAKFVERDAALAEERQCRLPSLQGEWEPVPTALVAPFEPEVTRDSSFNYATNEPPSRSQLIVKTRLYEKRCCANWRYQRDVKSNPIEDANLFMLRQL